MIMTFETNLLNINLTSFMQNPIVLEHGSKIKPAIGKVINIEFVNSEGLSVVTVELAPHFKLRHYTEYELFPEFMVANDGEKHLLSFGLTFKHSPGCAVHRTKPNGPAWCCTCLANNSLPIVESKNRIDFTDLEEEVTEHWDSIGEQYSTQELLTDDPYPIYEPFIDDDHIAILEDPMQCINELGFDSLASYIASKRAEEDDSETITAGLDFGFKNPPVIFMSGVLSKRFREAHGKTN